MAPKKNKNTEPAGDETDYNQADDDNPEQPGIDSLVDDDEEEDGFDFGALLPQGVEFVDLTPDFVRPEGFLMVPRLNKKTGEIFPMNSTFVGILHDVVPWKDNRGKDRLWFACEATIDIPGVHITGVDENK